MAATAKFYLVSHPNKKHPECVECIDHVNAKCKCNGVESIIITEETINDDSVDEKTQDEAQAIIDGWVADENMNPPVDPVTGETMSYHEVNLEVFLEDG